MSVESIFWKQAGDAVRSSLPEMVYLFDAFIRRKAKKFQTVSQHGTKLKRITLTAALTVTCGAASYLIYKLDPFDGLEGIMPTPERAAWTALVPLLAAFLAYWLVRRPLPKPILSTFLNLGLVTCVALTVIPGVLSLAGANSSTLASDIRQFRAGRGAGTPVHQMYCSTLEERAEINALMRRLERNGQGLSANSRLLVENSQSLMENSRVLMANGQRLDSFGRQIVQVGGPGRADPAALQGFLETRYEGLQILRHGLALQREGKAIRDQGMALHREGFAINDRSIHLQQRQTTAFYRLLGRYPVATTLLGVAIAAGVLMWLFAAVIAWSLVVIPQPTRKKRILVGTSLVFAFLLVSIGFSLLRSGMLEVLLQEPPTREMLEAQLRNQFEAAAPLCGKLNNYGL